MTLANWKAAPSRARGRLPTGPGLSNWARAQAASHVQVRAVRLLVGVVLLVLAGCGGPGPAASSPADQTNTPTPTAAGTGQRSADSATPHTTTGTRPAAIPAPVRAVVVIMENHAYGQIIGNPAAPFINAIADRGALFTRSYGVAHPSEPNYLALFSGSTAPDAVTDDVPVVTRSVTAPTSTAVGPAQGARASYAEGMSGSCSAAAPRTLRSTCRGPYMWGSADRTACQHDDFPMGASRLATSQALRNRCRRYPS